MPLRGISAEPTGFWVIAQRDLVPIEEGRPVPGYPVAGSSLWFGQAIGRLWVMSTQGLFLWLPAD